VFRYEFTGVAGRLRELIPHRPVDQLDRAAEAEESGDTLEVGQVGPDQQSDGLPEAASSPAAPNLLDHRRSAR
jgi:hypothetical protein